MTDFLAEYNKLNSAQKRAVDSIDGPVAVIAGPGTGKTQLLGMRVANILRHTDTLPSNILCLTFTESAADNIRKRLVSLIGNDANHVEIFTFHGLGSYIIQNFPEYFNESPLLNHLNELGQYEVLQNLLDRLHHDNPLTKKVGDQYLHLPTLISTISWFKQSGLEPSDLISETLRSKAFFKKSNAFLNATFQVSPASKFTDLYSRLLKNLKTIAQEFPSGFAEFAIAELELAISEINPKSSYAKPITEWRNKWLIQVRVGHWEFVDQQRSVFLSEVTSLYASYEENLKKNGLYTYDDMILRTIEAASTHQELLLRLQEKYQYVLVDEYQDTNGAQNKLLSLLGDNPINEERPNIMVVGDDDQAIYRFQGAESSIIYEFIKRWRSPEVIVLSENYRSGQELLDFARRVILHAGNRIESRDKRFKKILTSGDKESSTEIHGLATLTETEHYIKVAQTIKKLLDSGTSPSKIAVIAPKHRYLKTLESYLVALSVPISYEQREHILQQPRIAEIIDLLNLIWAATKPRGLTIEALLPKILAAPYFQLSTNNWWEIAILAQKDRQGWLKAIEEYGSPALRDFAEAIKKLGKQANEQQFDLILAYLLGNKSIVLEEGKTFSFPWRDYYFSNELVLREPAEYIKFIGQFNTLLSYFKDWNVNQRTLATINDFYRFIELYKSSKLTMIDESPYMSAKESVTLTTAYKAKGLEWDIVFALNCHDDVWGPKTRNRNLTFKLPWSLKWIEPTRLDSGDLVRLFYVAITRAKRSLYLTSYELKDNGAPTAPLEWLSDVPEKAIKYLPSSDIDPINVIKSFDQRWTDLYTTPTEDLSIILKPLLENYKISATHLSNYLAVDRGGPRYFLFKSLLKIPDLLSPNVIYGQAIHKTIEFIHKQLISTQKLPKANDIHDYFVSELKSYPLTNNEFKFLKKRGEDNLTAWLGVNGKLFKISDVSEHNFARENIVIGKAKLTGKIDAIRELPDNKLSVIDYKTSQPILNWKGNSGINALKSHSYEDQLMFYKLLVDNSSSFGAKYKTSLGQINFVSPDKNGEIISLDYLFDDELISRFKKLISAVWDKILALDFPDVNQYSPNVSGVRQFEEDLLSGKI